MPERIPPEVIQRLIRAGERPGVIALQGEDARWLEAHSRWSRVHWNDWIDACAPLTVAQHVALFKGVALCLRYAGWESGSPTPMVALIKTLWPRLTYNESYALDGWIAVADVDHYYDRQSLVDRPSRTHSPLPIPPDVLRRLTEIGVRSIARPHEDDLRWLRKRAAAYFLASEPWRNTTMPTDLHQHISLFRGVALGTWSARHAAFAYAGVSVSLIDHPSEILRLTSRQFLPRLVPAQAAELGSWIRRAGFNLDEEGIGAIVDELDWAAGEHWTSSYAEFARERQALRDADRQEQARKRDAYERSEREREAREREECEARDAREREAHEREVREARAKWETARAALMAELEDAGPVERLRVVASRKENYSFFPTEWADIPESLMSELDAALCNRLIQRLRRARRGCAWHLLRQKLLAARRPI